MRLKSASAFWICCSCQTRYLKKTQGCSVDTMLWHKEWNFMIKESAPFVWMGSYIENGGGSYILRVWSWLLWWDSGNFLILLYKRVMNWWRAGLGPYHLFSLPVASCQLHFVLFVGLSKWETSMRSIRRLFLANYRKSFFVTCILLYSAIRGHWRDFTLASSLCCSLPESHPCVLN